MARPFFKKLRDDNSGLYAVEFALVSPVFFVFLFGIFEIAIVLLRSVNLEAAAQSGAEYIVRSAIGNKVATEAELRSVVRAEIPFAAANQNLKVSLTRVDASNLDGLNVSFPVANRFETSTNPNQTYVLTIGYDVNPILPWTSAVIPYRGNKPQIQSVALVNTSVKVTG